MTQPLPQFKDEVAERAANSKLCGERTYKLIDGHSFINLLIPVDPWISNIQIDLFTLDTSKIGQYTVTLEVKLVQFLLPPPILATFSVTILPHPKNNLPYFEPKLMGSATIQKTKDPTSWTLKLPGFIDLDNDPVTLTANFGSASNFLVLEGQNIVCDDISKATLKAGMYLLKILLDDKRDIVNYSFSMFVIDLPPEPEPEPKPVVAIKDKIMPEEEIKSSDEDGEEGEDS